MQAYSWKQPSDSRAKRSRTSAFKAFVLFAFQCDLHLDALWLVFTGLDPSQAVMLLMHFMLFISATVLLSQFPFFYFFFLHKIPQSWKHLAWANLELLCCLRQLEVEGGFISVCSWTACSCVLLLGQLFWFISNIYKYFQMIIRWVLVFQKVLRCKAPGVWLSQRSHVTLTWVQLNRWVSLITIWFVNVTSGFFWMHLWNLPLLPVQGTTVCLRTLWTRAPSHTCPTCKCWTSAQVATTSLVTRRWRRSGKHKTRSLELTLDCMVWRTEKDLKWDCACECRLRAPSLCCERESRILLVQETGWSYFSCHSLGWLE